MVGSPLAQCGGQPVLGLLGRLAAGFAEGEPALLQLELLHRSPHDGLLLLDFLAKDVDALQAMLEPVEGVGRLLLRLGHALAQRL